MNEKKDIVNIKEILTLLTHTNTCIKKLSGLLKYLDSIAIISYNSTKKVGLLEEKIDKVNHSLRVCRMIKEQKIKTYSDLYGFMNLRQYRIVRNCGKKMQQDIERFFFSRGYFYE